MDISVQYHHNYWLSHSIDKFIDNLDDKFPAMKFFRRRGTLVAWWPGNDEEDMRGRWRNKGKKERNRRERR